MELPQTNALKVIKSNTKEKSNSFMKCFLGENKNTKDSYVNTFNEHLKLEKRGKGKSISGLK